MAKAFKCDECGEFTDHGPVIPWVAMTAGHNLLLEVKLKSVFSERQPDWCYNCAHDKLDAALNNMEVRTNDDGRAYIWAKKGASAQ